MEPPDHLDHLPLGIGGSDEGAMGERPVLEELDVPGEEDPVLLHGDTDELGVVESGVVAGVEPEQPEVSGEAPEMDVEHEPGPAEWLRPETDERPNVEGLEHRVHRDPVAVGHPVLEPHGPAVHQDQLDLGVGHPAGLDEVLDAAGDVEGANDRPPFGDVLREEVLQLCVEADRGLHRGSCSMIASPSRTRVAGRP